ncbi:putative inactive serine/threonine-protein kinase scy1 [Gracilariopsis chorda]|uniref:Putative inactive serine/threonine-protein kinase scy1 n=1 Tax=Gracilariopsis chorda TaxID=448386 RepID=A0A2V3J518_9FLOR|nr:putative inactive serine/threonine-protein kinase scy1 [Gracilariopsis chorda]|eukprot:PXF48470.1 putative inactive serine/threonine-protein kinase scy1 [Gracilariopsis chorda]
MQYFQKLIQKDLGFTYTLNEPVVSHDRAEIWALHRGTSKETGDPALVLHFEASKSRPGLSQKQNLAKTGLMRLKTLRHPDVLKYLTSVEGSDGTIYAAVEDATPLATILANSPSKLDREAMQWGLFTISRALGFLHSSGLIHGRLNSSTVFVTPTGDWKLGGLECVTQHTQAATLSQHAASLQDHSYQSPEFSSGRWSSVAAGAPSAVDSWALGCLMFHVHAGSLTAPDQLQNMAALPKPLLSAYQKLLASNAAARAPAGQLPNHPYFKASKFIELNLFVENIALKGPLEREAFMSKLPAMMDRLPDGFCTFKILPMLSQSIESGAGGSSAFSCVMKTKDRLSIQDFAKIVVKKYAVLWFSNQQIDRGLKVELYNNLNIFVEHMDDSDVNSTIFNSMASAFQDMQAPALRDAAVKSVLVISDRLTDKNLNSVLMSHFARLQVDPEPAIRTNTTVCLGKLAPRLSSTARNKVLAAAFLRSLKDPFPHARAAGINAILATTEYYSVKDMATRLLPSIVTLLIDSSDEVRTAAFTVVAKFQEKLSRNHEEMLRAEESTTEVSNGGRSTNSSTTRAGSTGWGLSSFSSMAAALVSTKSESGAHANKSTGISSEDFKRGRPVPTTSANGPEVTHNKPVAQMASSNVKTNDPWDATSGSSSSVPPAFSSVPLPVGGMSQAVPQNTNLGMGSFGDMGNGLGDDDDADGWGDMDIKSESKPLDDEDLFVSMMGQPKAKPTSVPRGMTTSNSNSSSIKSSGEDGLWDLAPPKVNRPKPRAVARPAAGLGSTSAARRTKKTSGNDDWEALLGGTTSKRRTTGRSGAR